MSVPDDEPCCLETGRGPYNRLRHMVSKKQVGVEFQPARMTDPDFEQARMKLSSQVGAWFEGESQSHSATRGCRVHQESARNRIRSDAGRFS